MSTTEAGTDSPYGARALDEDTIAAVRRRIGIPVRRSPKPHNLVSSTDSFRHFAQAYGDDNPLYCDPAYATASPWESPVAPPIYPYSAGLMRKAEWTTYEKAEMSGGDPLGGLGQYMCGERWVFVKPIRAGDAIWRTQSLFSAELKSSSFGGGTGALVSHRIAWEDDRAEPFAYRFLDYWHADRQKSEKSGKYRNVERQPYSDEDLERIEELYESEAVRGASPLSIQDVKVGDTLGPIAKGPIGVTEIICWHIGVGMGDYGVAALKLGYQNRKRVPKFYQRNELRFWEAAQRCHWDQPWAEKLGHPAPYDYGIMRTTWMVHLLTNWMGDGAWIWKLSSSVRKFNYMGDVHLITGIVREVDKTVGTVTIDVEGVNQRGEVTCNGRAVVILPRTGGRAELPEFNPDDVPEAEVP
jgi:acyl dehydratase